MMKPDFGRYIDHTLLRPIGTTTDIHRLCSEAIEYGMAAVCIFPSYIPIARGLLKDTRVKFATVIAFPFGITFTEIKEAEMRASAARGADETDFVINIAALKSGEDKFVEEEMQLLTSRARTLGVHTKFIIETAYLSEDEKIRACKIANRVRPDFMKTSTGYGPAGATVNDVRFGRQHSNIDSLNFFLGERAGAGTALGIPGFPSDASNSGLPDFELTDQSEARVALSRLNGKVVAVTFIYSRCPLPDYCPRMVENFRAIRARFADRMDRDLVLLTISFDPQYDTPQVLARYAASMRAGGPGWHFLTGDPANIERVCNAFGIQYFPDEGLITHSLQTAVVDRDGRLAATVEGKEFTPRQLGDLIATVLGQP